MPKSKRSSKPAKSGKEEVSGNDNPVAMQSTYLVNEGEKAKAEMNFSQAATFFEKAIQIDPNNTNALDCYAELLIALDNFDMARKLFEKSIELAPDEHHAKWLSMGQLSEGQQAVSCFEKGIMLLQRDINECKIATEKPFLVRQLSDAYCSIADVYLTDECFHENAEMNCEKVLHTAIQVDPSNPMPYQTLASVRISQCRNEEALQTVTQSYHLWKDLEFENLPDFEYRHNCAKLFLELDQHKTAISIWEGLLDEDDSIAEVHYFLGMAYCNSSMEDAYDCFKEANKLLIAQGAQETELAADVQKFLMQTKGSNDDGMNVEEDDVELDDDDFVEEEDDEMEI